MSFNENLEKTSSSKITLIEIDSPLQVIWVNKQPGIWQTTISPGSELVADDNGNFGYWDGRNSLYFNIGSLNVGGEIYTEVADLATVITTEKSWFYDTDTTIIYVQFADFNPPEFYSTKAPGAVIGFTYGEDKVNDNYFEDIYYIPSVKSIPNLSKKKDSLFFGLLQYQGGTITFNNEDGFFDNFATLDLYGQPVRIRLSFEGLAYSESLLVYSGKVEDFTHDFATFKLKIADVRKLLSRKLPIKVFDSTTYPNMDSKLIGTPIPLIFGSVIGVPAYRTSAGNWQFADTTFNSILATIDVYDKDGNTFAHGGVETDGTFTGADTTDKLYLDCEQSSVANGLDIISDILENYENVTFNSSNYDVVEWTQEKNSVLDEGIFIGKGNLMSSVDVIEQDCTDNQGVFDVLADGKFTFRSYNPNKTPIFEIFEDELLDDPSIKYDSEEYLSSVKVEYSMDWLNKDPEIFTNSDFEGEVFGRYRQYKERTFETALTSETDAETLTDSIMELSKFIFPIIKLTTKIQNINMRILDNILYTCKRQNGSIIIPRSRYQVLGINLNLSNYEMSITIKQIAEDDNIYIILDGGDSTTDYDFYDGGDSTTTPTNIISGGAA